jgi:outer membrane protein assembly factor BamE
MFKKLTMILCAVSVAISLASCHLFRVHRPDIQQGNFLTADQLKSVHKGMTREQVISQLGDPVLSNLYYPNQLIYVYSYEPAYKKLKRQYLILTLKNNKVIRIQTDMEVPGHMIPKPATAKKASRSKVVTLPQTT